MEMYSLHEGEIVFEGAKPLHTTPQVIGAAHKFKLIIANYIAVFVGSVVVARANSLLN